MTMITPSYLGETIEYSSLHACRSTLEDPTAYSINLTQSTLQPPHIRPFYVFLCSACEETNRGCALTMDS